MSSQVSKLTLPTIALSLMTVVAAVAGLNLALPSIAIETQATQTELTWIIDSYTVVFAGLLFLAGTLGDRFGRRRALFVGLTIFAIGALIGFFQTTPEGLIAVRAIMGVGAAAIMPSTLSVITTSFPEEKRGKAVGIWVGVAGGGAVLGLFATAFLLEFYAWNSFFAFNALIAFISILGLSQIPESQENLKSTDWIGGVLSVVSISALVFGIIEGPEAGWGSVESTGGLLIGITALVAFIFWELHHPAPLLDPRLFKIRGFSSGSLSIAIQFFAQFGFIFVGMQYLQFVAGLSPLESAARLLWLPLVVLPGSRLAGALVKRVSQKVLGTTGLVIFGYSMIHFSNLPLEYDYWYFTIGILLFGAGLALAATPATVAITSSLPDEKQGVASAMNDVAREVGAAVGIAILGATLTDSYRNEMKLATQQLPDELATKLESSVAFTQMQPPPGLEANWPNLIDAGLASFNVGVQNSLFIAGVVSIAGAILIAIIAPRLDKQRS